MTTIAPSHPKKAAPSRKSEQEMTLGDWAFAISQGIANSVLAVLGIGLLLTKIGELSGFHGLVLIGNQAQVLLAPALGMGIAVMLRTTTLVTGATMIAATVGANAVSFTSSAAHVASATGWARDLPAGTATLSVGQPVSAVITAVVAAVIGKWLTDKTPLDMVLVPLATSLFGSLLGLGLATVVTPALTSVSHSLASTMQINPILGSAIVGMAWFLFLLTPASSAALAIALALDPMSAGAALIGTTVGFISFFAMAPRQNNIGANLAQTLVTVKIQFPNMLKNPLLLIGPCLIAPVMSVIAVVMFNFQVPYLIGGVGLNSLIAPIALTNTPDKLAVYTIFGVIIPAALSFLYYRFLKAIGKTKPNDLYLEGV